MGDYASLDIVIDEFWEEGATFEVNFPGLSNKKLTYTEPGQISNEQRNNSIALMFLTDSDVTDHYDVTANNWNVTLTAKEKGIDWNFGVVSKSAGADISWTKYDTPYNPIIASVASITHVELCYGDTTGAISISVTQGYSPFSYQWTKNGSSGFSRTTKNISGVGAGTYNVKITDSIGQVKNLNNIVITQPDELIVQVNIVDQDVTVAVSGGVTPYSYEWSDGPTVKNRTGMAEGEYLFTVTDANGCEKSATVIIDLVRFYFSKNPIALSLSADSPGSKPNLSFVAEVHLEDVYDSDTYTNVMDDKLEQPADGNGDTVFDVSAILDASESLKMHVPAYNETDITIAEGVFKRYKLKHAEKYGTPPAEQSFTIVAENYVINGGLSYEEYAENNFFNSYFTRVLPFLTWQPTRKRVFLDQPEFLYFIVPFSGTTTFKLRIKIHYKNGSEFTHTKFSQGSLNKYEVYCIPAGYNQLGIADYKSGLEVLWYELNVIDQNSNALSEVRRYDIEQGHYPYRRYFLYQNSLGGSDTIVCVGQASSSLRTKDSEASRTLAHDYDIKDGEELVVSKVGESRLDLSTGFKSKEYIERAQDFVISKEVYLMANNRYVPVKVTSRYKDEEGENLHMIKVGIDLPKLKSFTPFLGEEAVPDEVPDFSLISDEYDYVLEQGTSASVLIDIERIFDFDEEVTLSIEQGLPGDVTAVFIPSATSGIQSSLLLTAAGAADPSSFNLIIKGVSDTYPNGRYMTIDVNVTIAPDLSPPVFTEGPTVGNITSSGFEVTVALNEPGTVYYGVVGDGQGEPSLDDMLAGTITTFVDAGNVQMGADVSTVIPVGGLSPGDPFDLYVLAIDLHGNIQAAMTKVDVSTAAAPDFTLSIDEDVFSIEKGGNDGGLITITKLNGFNEDVYLAVQNLPSGVTAGLSDNPISGGGTTSTLTLNVIQAAETVENAVVTIKAISASYPTGKTITIDLTTVEQSVLRVYISDDYITSDYIE